MARLAYLILVTAMIALGGCNDSGGVGPSQLPAPSPAPPSAPRPRGEITMSDISPGAGATLRLRDCSTDSWRSICTDELRLTHQVLVDRDIPDGIFNVTFYDGTLECGQAWLDAALTAGRRTALSTSRVELLQSNEGFETLPGTLQPCQVPATTTRIVARLWLRNNPRSPVLTSEVESTYTFAFP